MKLKKYNEQEIQEAAKKAALGIDEVTDEVIIILEKIVQAAKVETIQWTSMPAPEKAIVYQGKLPDCMLLVACAQPDIYRGTCVAQTGSVSMVVIPPRLAHLLFLQASNAITDIALAE